MNFLVISGAPNTGKTSAINKIAEWLTNGVITHDLYGEKLPVFSLNVDFSIVINLNNKKIIVHSATDDQDRIDELSNKLIDHPDTDVVITSCRDIYWQRQYFITNIHPKSSFLLEVPLAKITRRANYSSALTWYNDTNLILHQHILRNSPYYL